MGKIKDLPSIAETNLYKKYCFIGVNSFHVCFKESKNFFGALFSIIHYSFSGR